MKKVRVIALVVLFSVLASGCYTLERNPIFWPDPDYNPRKDWWAGIPLEKGYPTACLEAGANYFFGPGWQCRSMHGVESAGHNMNYLIKDLSDGAIVEQWGSDTSQYGRGIMMEDGRVFEGCDWISPNNSYWCDFFSYKYTAPFQHDSGGTDYFLRTLWDFAQYSGTLWSCATGVKNVFAGDKFWKEGWLIGCAAGPMGGYWAS